MTAESVSMNRSFVSVGGATALSRLLGFVRDMLLASVLGAGPVADAFFAAFRFPNLFRRLFAEGAFNAAFIPLFSKALQEGGEDAARDFARRVISWLIAALVVLTVLAEIFMPAVIAAFVPGFLDDPEKFDLTVLLTRICFPYLACMSLMAAYGGVLNGLRRFLAAAFAPVLLNVVLIGVLAGWVLWADAGTETAGIALSVGVLIGGVAQLALVVWGLARTGYLPRFVRPRFDAGVKRFWALAVPAILTGGITQINIFIGTIIASSGASAISYLYYADRLYQLPLGVIGIAIGVVLLPELSRHLTGGRAAEAASAQNQALFAALVLTVPAALALTVIAEPVIRVLFERGAFGAEATARTAAALVMFACGLPAFVMIKVFQPGFFARQDTRTPTIFAAISAVVNIGLSLALFPSLAHVGIALATAIAAWVNTALLVAMLVRRKHFQPTAPQLRHAAIVLVAATVMAVALMVAAVPLDALLRPASGLATQIAGLAALVAIGGVVYFGILHFAGVQRLGRLADALRGRA
ncbi:MAG TPA: murein biosynthesis integral membrane protein MurJ [Devosiaceae bacterium]|nr:murein biosynthesis integral membrane protein MurJ [Devosiaceae bacterium]